jgi:hypothetical protein
MVSILVLNLSKLIQDSLGRVVRELPLFLVSTSGENEIKFLYEGRKMLLLVKCYQQQNLT